METNKEEIDRIIKEALTEEEAKFYDTLDEQNLVGQIGGLFKTKISWLIVVMNVVSLLMVVFAIYCVVQFFDTENTKELIQWAGGFFICWSFVAMIKLFVWMQMDKNALLRELKRLELQQAALATKS